MLAHSLAQTCIQCLATQPCVANIMTSMKGATKVLDLACGTQSQGAVPAACEMVSRIFEANHTALVGQVFLLEFLCELDFLAFGLPCECVRDTTENLVLYFQRALTARPWSAAW